MAQTVRDFLDAQANGKLNEAAALTEKAETEAREMKKEETAEVQRLLDDVAGIKAQIKAIDDQEDLRKQIDSIRGPVIQVHEDSAPGVKSIGEAFVKSDAYQALKGGGFGKGSRWSTGGIEMPWNGKATVTEAASPIVNPDVRPGIQPLLVQRLTVADLIPQGSTDSTSVEVVREVSETNAAAAVTPGDDKPESTIGFDVVSEPVRKIATFLPVTDEMLEDVSAIRSYLDARLSLFVQIKEEQQLLTGTGDAPQLSGIMDRAIGSGSALSLDTDRSTDAIYRAMTVIRTSSFLEPDGLVIHPTDWASIRLLKDENGQYYGGGPFTGAYGNGGLARDTLWNLNVVVTTAMTQGTALVGAFAQGAFIWRRSGLTVEASNSHDDFFQKNLTAIRAEERLALGVLRPAAFYKITGIDALMGS